MINQRGRRNMAIKNWLVLFVFGTQMSLIGNATASSWHEIISLGGGVVFSNDVGHAASFPILNPITDQYYQYHASNAVVIRPLYEGFFGGEVSLHHHLALQLGVDYLQTGDLNANGNFFQGVDYQSADIFTYHYKIIGRQILAAKKLLYKSKKIYHPYVFAGVGMSDNTAYRYGTDVPPFLTFTRQYANLTEASFSYSVGAGIDVDINKHFRMGVGYRFTDLGKASLGSTQIDNVNVTGTLAQTNLYASEVLMQLSIVI
jgi:hypothetical protein